MLVGLLLIGSTFYVQKQEDKERLPGYYTTGTLVANKENLIYKNGKLPLNLQKIFRFCVVLTVIQKKMRKIGRSVATR